MRRKIYVSLLLMGFTCMIVTNLIAGWFFLRTMERQVAEEMDMTANLVKASVKKLAARKMAIFALRGLIPMGLCATTPWRTFVSSAII